jgi:hypothetical protein
MANAGGRVGARLAGMAGLALLAAAAARAQAAGPARDLLAPAGGGIDLLSRVRANDAVPSLVERDGRKALRVLFKPGANVYPGIYLLPPSGGRWDLSDCNRVEFRIANTGAAAVQAGCRVSDGPVTDGHKHCNTEMATLEPGESRLVAVVFGRSYGGPGWNLDRAGVVNLEVYADNPGAEAVVEVRGVTARGGDLPGQVRVVADENWQPLAHHLLPDKGGALDFSFLLDAPAGRHGPVTIREGRLEFRDKAGEPARFYGANVVYGANFPDKETAVVMADQLARNGYNSLRFHHFDQLLLDPSAGDSLTFDPRQTDRLDFFFACLKERGIYPTIDLYCTRETRPGEIPELDGKATMSRYKSAVYILDSARRNWEEFARRLLTHVNPYTGLAWKDDPALFAVSLINEGQVYQTWEANRALYEERFAAWNREAAAAGQSEEQRAAAWNRFLTGIQRRWIREATAFVRGLGTEVLITDANYIPMRPLSVFRTDLEIVDIHCYFDGPQPLAGWGAPLRCGHDDLVKDGGVHMPLYSIAGRLPGKPFMITEFNIGYPNRYRSVCGPMVGALSAFQAIDAVHRFDHIGVPLDKPGAIIWLSCGNDPVALLSDRLGAALFLRPDVRPAGTAVPWLVTDACLDKPGALDWSHWYPDSYIAIGTRHRIGTVVLQGEETLPENTAGVLVSTEKVPAGRLGGATLVDLAGLSGLGLPPAAPEPQIRIDRGQGTLRIVTDRAEVLFVPDGHSRLEGDFLGAGQVEHHATIGVVSLDGLPLARSRRAVVLHLTDVVNENELYRDGTRQVLEQYGGPGLLARRGSARITLRGVAAGARLFALDLAGRRREEVPLETVPGGVAFTARTRREGGACLAYEMTR